MSSRGPNEADGTVELIQNGISTEGPILLQDVHFYQLFIHLPSLTDPPGSFETQQLHSIIVFHSYVIN